MATETKSTARRAGTLFLQINGEIYDALGDFSYNLGEPKRETIVGADRVHGFSETPQAPFIEGKVTDRRTLDLRKLLRLEGATVTLKLAGGKTVVLRDGWYCGSGDVAANKAEVEVRFEGLSADELR